MSASPAAATASVRYLAWRDKSGDVWEDLAVTLLDRGLARVAPGDFAEREQYLSRERAARSARRGVWADGR
jgi:endonuclease YncB( thermonuclease family)